MGGWGSTSDFCGDDDDDDTGVLNLHHNFYFINKL